MTWAKVGMKVVCINSDPSVFSHLPHNGTGDFHLAKGSTYTIRWVGEANGLQTVKLSELPDRTSDFGYALSRFRPLVTKTQSEDVAMFKRIADQVPNMEDVG
jgi:hypothetical protein